MVASVDLHFVLHIYKHASRRGVAETATACNFIRMKAREIIESSRTFACKRKKGGPQAALSLI